MSEYFDEWTGTTIDHLPSEPPHDGFPSASEIAARLSAMNTEDAAALRGIADDLMEARRHVRTDPDHARKAIGSAWFRWPSSMSTDWDLIRANRNTDDGIAAIRHDPLILEGHLYAAARLLQSIARRLETEADDG